MSSTAEYDRAVDEMRCFYFPGRNYSRHSSCQLSL